MFVPMTEHGVLWQGGQREAFDAVIGCTGFRPAPAHLAPLGMPEADGRVQMSGTRAVKEPRLWPVGYGASRPS